MIAGSGEDEAGHVAEDAVGGDERHLGIDCSRRNPQIGVMNTISERMSLRSTCIPEARDTVQQLIGHR